MKVTISLTKPAYKTFFEGGFGLGPPPKIRYLTFLYLEKDFPITEEEAKQQKNEDAEEIEEKGKKDTTAYWRTLKEGGIINPKYPGGIETQGQL